VGFVYGFLMAGECVCEMILAAVVVLAAFACLGEYILLTLACAGWVYNRVTGFMKKLLGRA